LSAPPDPLAAQRGLTSKGTGGEGREGKVREGEGRGRGGEREEKEWYGKGNKEREREGGG